MKVFVTGSTGFVGQAVVRALVKNGHEVVALVHTASKGEKLKGERMTLVVGDLNDDASVAAAMKGCEAIAHCAQPEFYTKRLSAGFVRSVAQIELAWTQRLLKAGQGTAKVFVSTSGAWVYGDRGETMVDETSATTTPFRAGAFKLDAEKLAFEQGKALGYSSVVALRAGAVYGPGGTFETFNLGPMRKGGKARWIGSGKQWVSPIQVDDLGEAFAAAIKNQPGFEIINAVDDEPVVMHTYLGFLADKMGAKAPGGVPTFVVSLVGGLIAEALSGGHRVSNAKAKRVLGWKPLFPTYREGFTSLAADVKAGRA